MGCSKMVSRVRLRKFLFSGITSCLSVRRKDSQGCTADVKDTPPSPKENCRPDDLIGPDIDPVRDHDDLMAEEIAQLRREMMAEEIAQLRREMRAEREAQRDMEMMAEEIAQLRREMMAEEIAQLRREMRAEREAQRDMEMMAEEIAQLRREMRAKGSMESIDSGVSLKSDWSKAEVINFKDRVSPRWGDSGSDVVTLENLKKRWVDLIVVRRAQLYKERWWDFDSDMSAVEDFNKLLKNLRT
ncbi:uncharacterized protein LOC144467036 isoform X1 [Epinephelus lanceolatus]